ncbi:MAG: UPF0176 protein [marine bacterium B5-7]|nr:MAG: UPF0176 protein [marine bacterium B5-7]
MQDPDQSYKIATFYKFVALPDVTSLREILHELCTGLGLTGTILLASEGINATLSGPPDALDDVITHLREDPRYAAIPDIEVRFSYSPKPPFRRMKVKLREEIVTLGIDAIDPVNMAGTYVSADQWNTLISRDDVVTIDTRNDYEVSIGTFTGALNPHTTSFSDLPKWIDEHPEITPDTPVAMFCTGGIRCEKSTAYLRQMGFNEVYHLKGGILDYLQTVDQENSLWQGECFVFDERVSLRHGLEPGDYTLCSQCGAPVAASTPPLPLSGDTNGQPVCERCSQQSVLT